MKRYVSAAINNIENESNSVKCQLAQSLSTSPRDLAKLANDPDYYVVRNVAANPNTPADILRTLATGAENIRYFVAANPSIPDDVANFFASEASLLVRGYLAKNPNISTAVIDTLFNSPGMHSDDTAILSIFQHPNTSAATRERARDLLDGTFTLLSFTIDREPGHALSDYEISDLKVKIWNNPTITSFALACCSLVNYFDEDDVCLGYIIILTLDLLTSNDIDAVYAAIESIIAPLGDTIADWDEITQ